MVILIVKHRREQEIITRDLTNPRMIEQKGKIRERNITTILTRSINTESID